MTHPGPAKKLRLRAVIASLVLSASALAAPDAPVRLRTEWLAAPLAVDAAAPRFSWEVVDARRGAVQAAYEVHVSSTPSGATGEKPDVWTSGVVESGDTMHVEYEGPALRPAGVYHWSVRTRDTQGDWSAWSTPAAFGVAPSPAEWGGAAWIGDPTPAPAGKPAHNGYHSEFAKSADTEKWVTIDLTRVQEVQSVALHPARPHDFSPDTPGFGFPVRYRVLGSETPGFERPLVLADRAGADAPAPGEDAVSVETTPAKVRYVRLQATRLHEGKKGEFALALAEMRVLSAGKVVSVGAPVIALDSIERNDWSTKFLTDGDLVSHKAQAWDALPAPVLRKEFGVDAPVRRAVLYVSALGVYQARLNGERVGDQQLAPEWTDYSVRVQYQAYDVTKSVVRGANALGVILGDGWYAGRLGMAQGFTPDKRPRAVYGRYPRLLACLRIEREDGSVQNVVSDASWSSTAGGPVRSSDTLDGEVYDARREMNGFDRPGFSASGWSSAAVDASVKVRLDPQMNEPIRVIGTITPKAMTEPRPGVYVFDMGQNMPGWCRIRMKGKAGSTITLRHVEALNDDGTVYTANLRGAPQVDRYTLRGDPAGETWEPHFTYHGFRFVEWTAAGEAEKPTRDSLEGVVVTSDAPMAGAFECSSPMLNQLWSNILWTQHANTMSVPTDCPQRDERLGWMGDILAFAQTASFNKDLAAFYTKWLRDVRDAQADDGRFADVSPHPYGKNERFTGVPAWGDAGVFVPWVAYENYGDVRLLESHFDACRRWVDWIASKNPDLLWKNARHNDYNDWLNGDTLIADGWPRKGGEVPRDVFATAFFARSTWMVSQMARAIGKPDEAKKYAELADRIKAAFQAAFIDAEGKMPGDTQAGYALALGFDLLPADRRPQAMSHLLRGIEAYKGHLSTGFHSTHHAMIQMTDAGHADVAYRLVNNTTFPSWGYSIQNGSTTIWERWDGYVKGRGFQDPGMNSLNHWALGSVGEWMMRTIVGINPDPATPGWGHFELRPVPGGGLTYAKGSFHSPRGMIKSAWRVDPEATVYDVTVPANTTATLYLVAVAPGQIHEGNVPVEQAHGVKLLPDAGGSGGVFALRLGAGTYSFRVDR
jgi:alpha-L-rhamnosidase